MTRHRSSIGATVTRHRVAIAVGAAMLVVAGVGLWFARPSNAASAAAIRQPASAEGRDRAGGLTHGDGIPADLAQGSRPHLAGRLWAPRPRWAPHAVEVERHEPVDPRQVLTDRETQPAEPASDGSPRKGRPAKPRTPTAEQIVPGTAVMRAHLAHSTCIGASAQAHFAQLTGRDRDDMRARCAKYGVTFASP